MQNYDFFYKWMFLFDSILMGETIAQKSCLSDPTSRSGNDHLIGGPCG